MKRRPPDDPEVNAWLNKAKGDLRMARAANGLEDPLWDQCCFHAQQAAEKALKAFWVSMDQDVPRTHDLVYIVEKIVALLPEANDILEDAAAIAQYGVSPRYPSFLASETEEDAREAMRRSLEIYEWAVSRLTDPSD